MSTSPSNETDETNRPSHQNDETGPLEPTVRMPNMGGGENAA